MDAVTLYIALIILTTAATAFFSKKLYITPIKQELSSVKKDNVVLEGKFKSVESSLTWFAYDLLMNAKENKLIGKSDIELVDRLINECSELNNDKSKLKEFIDVDGPCNLYKSKYPERWYFTLVKQILLRNVESAFDPAI